MRTRNRHVLLVIAASLPLLVWLLADAGQPPPTKPARKLVLVIHGGEGDLPEKVSPESEKKYREVLEEALRQGYARLRREKGTSLDAVEAAIRVLEDSPLFNAGKGAVFTHEGRNELDASIMEGKHKKAGAVAGVTIVKNPISAARAVMEHSPHVLLVGRGAELFAIKQKLDIVHPDYFWTEQRWKELQEALQKEAKRRQDKEGTAEPRRRHFGTVGAVALDREGNLAAGTSTGGMTNKWSGRVGDSPIIGAGTYADNEACAVSCTGWGEYFIRYAVAHDITARVKYGRRSVKEAAEAVINGQLQSAGAEGGAIVLGRGGDFHTVYNRLAGQMSRGFITSDDERPHAAILDKRLPK
jgi:beta-aspartyl-peptidase (threonine type)